MMVCSRFPLLASGEWYPVYATSSIILRYVCAVRLYRNRYTPFMVVLCINWSCCVSEMGKQMMVCSRFPLLASGERYPVNATAQYILLKIYWHAKVSLHKRNTNIFQNKDHRETKFLCTKRPSVKLAGQPIFAGGSARGVRTGAYLEKHVRSV